MTTDSKLTNTIEERGKRYGTFSDNAAFMQHLKDTMRKAPNWDNLEPIFRESLDMIQHKIGRIICGDPYYVDSWHDIKGYADLSEKYCIDYEKTL